MSNRQQSNNSQARKESAPATTLAASIAMPVTRLNMPWVGANSIGEERKPVATKMDFDG